MTEHTELHVLELREPRKTAFLTFLSQGAAGGAVGTFFLICGQLLLHPNGYYFFIVILFPRFLFFGSLFGAAAGTAIWISDRLVKRNLGVVSRIAIAILFTTLLVAGVDFAEGHSGNPQLMSPFIPGAVFGLPSGILTDSNIRPWRMIARGISTRRPRRKVLFGEGPIRISRDFEELRFSFLAGLPLRAVSLLGLMESLLWAAGGLSFCLWDDCWSRNWEDFIRGLIAAAYFAATVIVSFSIQRKSLVLLMALLVNGPLAVWVISAYGVDTDTDFAIGLGSFVIGLWLLFVIGRVVLPGKKSELQVEYGSTEMRFGKRAWVKVQ